MFEKSVVVKVLRDPSQQAHSLFAREARRLCELEHPKIPRLKAAFQEGTEHYIVLEYIEGKNLAEVLQTEGPSTEDGAIRLLVDTLDALQAVHALQVVHRDIKPENIVRKDSTGSYFLVDFGASKQLLPGLGGVGRTVIGTSGYMAPEVGLGKSTIQSDFFSLGATALALLTAKKPRDLMSHDAVRPFESCIKDLVSSSKISVTLGNLLSSFTDARLDHRVASATAALEELRNFSHLARRPTLHSSSSSSSSPFHTSPSSPHLASSIVNTSPGTPSPRTNGGAQLPPPRSQVSPVLDDSPLPPSPSTQFLPRRSSKRDNSLSHGSETKRQKTAPEVSSPFFAQPGAAMDGDDSYVSSSPISAVSSSSRQLRSATTTTAVPEHSPLITTVDELRAFAWAKIGTDNLAATVEVYHEVDEVLNGKIALWKGNITNLEVDVIVNPAPRNFKNRSGSVNSAVHRLGGEKLTEECTALGTAEPGETRWTRGHNLPCPFVFHTVGPSDEDQGALRQCYQSSLDLLVTHPGKTVPGQVKPVPLRTIAYCCISAGGNGFPKNIAAKIAIAQVRKWLEKDDNAGKVDLILFCISKDDTVNYNLYEDMLMSNFPLS